jgi:hypothetical protein
LAQLTFAAWIIQPRLLVHRLGMHASSATTAGALLGLTLGLGVRRDLLPLALGSALASGALACPLVSFLDLPFPRVVQAHGCLDRLGGVILLAAPLEDVLRYGSTAASLGIGCKFWVGVVAEGEPAVDLHLLGRDQENSGAATSRRKLRAIRR